MSKARKTSFPRSAARLGVPIVAAAVLVATGATAETQHPLVDFALSQQPNAAGWFRNDVTINWTVGPRDRSLRSTEGCESAKSVAGETARRGINVTCSAVWRNGVVTTRQSVTINVKIDKTPPRVRAVAGRPPDLYGWYDHPVRFRFRGRDGLSGVAACSRRAYRGPNSGSASVGGSCRDVAGNSSARTVPLRYSNPLLRPRRGAKFRSAPLLDWITVRRARFYNVQVWRDGRKILTRWPRRSKLRMPSRWTHEGVTYSLSVSGRYDVYVWPRFRGRYGKSIGHTYFISR